MLSQRVSVEMGVHGREGSPGSDGERVYWVFTPFLPQTRRSLCEEALLKIRGVISFTFQMAVKRCVVRIRSDLKAEVSGTPCSALWEMVRRGGLVVGRD